MININFDEMINKRGGFGIKKLNLNNRGFLQISFAWLFAIIVGAIILFFAIYASVKLINTEESVSLTQAGQEISVLLNPLETGFGEEKTTPLSIAVESKVNNICNEFGEFGEQEIRVSQKTSGKWTDTGLGSISYNKYIFSNASVQGKDFYLFSKPFNFPFKVSDLIFLTSTKDSYCFADAPEEIREELAGLGQANLFIENCPEESINVCFGADSGCDVIVNENQKSVEHAGDGRGLVYYETDALMYAAIFSETDIYECQMKRLMKRLEAMALLYHDKEAVISGAGCIAEVSLLGLADSAASLASSADLINVASAAEDTEDSNENTRASCRLW